VYHGRVSSLTVYSVIDFSGPASMLQPPVLEAPWKIDLMTCNPKDEVSDFSHLTTSLITVGPSNLLPYSCLKAHTAYLRIHDPRHRVCVRQRVRRIRVDVVHARNVYPLSGG
jgi:hypothetical protein